MRTILNHILIGFVLCLFNLPLFSQNNIVVIDYMRLPEAGGGDYLKLEQEVWKPVHQEYINQGKLSAWYLLSVPYPGGTDADYHYMTVRVYDDMKHLDKPMENLQKVFAKVHAGKDLTKLFDQTTASRDLVKTYVYQNWESMLNPEDQAIPELIQMVYFKVPMAKTAAYMDLERKHYHPTHKAEMEADVRHGWAGLRLMMPYGTSAPYQFVALDFYKDWAQFIKPTPKDLFETTFPNGDPNERDQLFMETVELVKMEQTRMVDYLVKAQLASDKQVSTKE